MNGDEQLEVLARTPDLEPFRLRLDRDGKAPLQAVAPTILQMNVCRRCNLNCKHCHVKAGPDRAEAMSRKTMERCLEVARHPSITTIDITGGSPEMNEHLPWLLEHLSQLDKRIIVRSNLVILDEGPYRHLIDMYARHCVEVVASLPHFSENMSDRQRGIGSFCAAIRVMRTLNEHGYGKEGTGRVLDIVHNPVGAYLPGSQASLEQEYKQRLAEEQGVVFNSLFCITNMPIGRYLGFLRMSDNLHEYMHDLANAYNPAAVDDVMCRTTISVGWDGTLYDCDFNQMLGLPLTDGAPHHIEHFDADRLEHREIAIADHCYGCTAGAGSSCQGALAESERTLLAE